LTLETVGTRPEPPMKLPGPFSEHADRLLRHACETGSLPGVVAMLANRDGTLYEAAFGERSAGSGEPMTLDTVVWIASMTKALTTTAALQLVEQGRLELDAPVGGLVPQLGQARVLTGFDATGQPQTRPPRRPITLRHLLTHTCGFSHEVWSTDVRKAQAAWNLPRIGSGRRVALNVPLMFDPGERWEYGIGIDCTGPLIEAVSGQTLGAYLQEHVFAPLRMGSTAFALTPELRSRLAKVHQRGSDGVPTIIDFEVVQNPEFELGGGGLYSTAGDYLRFVRAILNGGVLDGKRVLRDDTVREMARNQIGALRVAPMKTALPAMSNDAEFFPGVAKTWGLGFQINEAAVPTGRAAGGLMWAGLANTYYWIDPSSGIGGVLLTQVLPFADAAALRLFTEFETLAYRAVANAA
jgi:methyl acetate hydrolase